MTQPSWKDYPSLRSKDELTRLFLTYRTYPEIAGAIGCPVYSVRKAAKHHGIPRIRAICRNETLKQKLRL
ncbi:MAG: hypothetical protein Q4Q04_04745 [Methanocorpusculum sp.]|nr:hypothetical protein [Methanocorpusculum sp.]